LKLSVGCPGNKEKVFELIEGFKQLNDLGAGHGNCVDEILLALKPTESNGIFGSGKDPHADLNIRGLEEIVLKAMGPGIHARVLLNSPNINPVFDDKNNRQSVEEYLRKLNGAGVHRITVASDFLLKFIKDRYPHFSVAVSSYLQVQTPERARELEDYGADRIILPNDLNVDLQSIKEMRDSVRCEIELMPNLGCFLGCPHHGVHGGYLDEQSKLPEQDRDNVDPYKEYCLPKMIEDPESVTLIRPSQVKEFEELGIEYFKIVGRQRPADWIIKATRAYMEMKYDGNLADLLVPTYAIAGKITLAAKAGP